MWIGLTAQISIEAGDMPSVGDIIEVANDTLAGKLDIGSAGPDQVWDFSSLVAHETGFQAFESPTGTIGDTLFPSATLALNLGVGYNYFELTDSFFLDLGLYADLFGTGTPVEVAINPPNKTFKIPSNYEDTYENNYNFSFTIDGSGFGVDSLRLVRTNIENNEIDAWGSLKMPFGTFDVLRIKKEVLIIDSIWIQVFGIEQFLQATANSSFVYNFVSKESKGSLASVTLDAEGIPVGVGFTVLPPIEPPTAQFSYVDNGSGSVNFLDESTNNPTSWQWDFGDSNTSTDQNPNHVFAENGDYTVCMLATNEFGTDTTCQVLTINVIPPPQAAFDYSPTATQSDATISFLDLSTGLPDSYLWNFGDGTTSAEQNPVHVYSEFGTYQVCLSVVNEGGNNTACQSIMVEFVPIANFSVNMLSDASFEFTDLSQNEPTDLSWEFGDGNVANGTIVTHEYLTSGDYTVCLLASNQAGVDTSCQAVTAIVVSTQNLKEKDFVQIFPNPANKVLTIEVDEPLSEDWQIVFNNALGQRIYRQNFDNQLIQRIPVGEWTNGMYTYCIINSDGVVVQSKQFVIQH